MAIQVYDFSKWNNRSIKDIAAVGGEKNRQWGLFTLANGSFSRYLELAVKITPAWNELCKIY